MISTNAKNPSVLPKPHKFIQTSASTKFIASELLPQAINIEKKTVMIPAMHIEAEVKQYEWRVRTELPVIKIIGFEKVSSDQNQTTLEISLESYPLRLYNIKDLPLFKILYLMKESIIGFERLFDKVGPFVITDKMIAVTQTHKCKVWIN